MNFTEALAALEAGQAVRRTDWGYAEKARLVLLERNDEKWIYIQAPHWASPDDYLEGYDIKYPDLKSTEWEIV